MTVMMASSLWLDKELREFDALGSNDIGYSPLGQSRSFEANTSSLNDEPGVEQAAPRRPSEESG